MISSVKICDGPFRSGDFCFSCLGNVGHPNTAEAKLNLSFKEDEKVSWRDSLRIAGISDMFSPAIQPNVERMCVSSCILHVFVMYFLRAAQASCFWNQWTEIALV